MFLHYLSRPAHFSDNQKLSKEHSNPYPQKVASPEVVYEGELNKNDELNGQGKKILDDGTIYEGQFEADELIAGKITYKIGTCLVGSFKNGKLNGQGKVIWFCGKIWEGQFKEGELTEGKISSSYSDLIYEGHFINQIFDLDNPFKSVEIVKGTITCGINSSRQGEFKNGKLNGCGKQTYKNIIWDGQFIDGELNGQGKFITNDVTLEGQFKNGKLNGHGKAMHHKFPGLMLEGVFKDFELIQGKHIFPNGDIYEGHFVNEKLNG